MIITYINDVWIRVEIPNSLIASLRDYFSFEVPGARYMPAVKAGQWDGYRRLWDARTGRIYAGLLPRVAKWAQVCGVTPTLVGFEPPERPVGLEAWVESLGLPMTPHDYQMRALKHALVNGRGTYISATGSGKSLLQYMIARWMVERDRRVLIIVPTIGLVKQMKADFSSYGDQMEVHGLWGGRKLDKTACCTVATWQSLHRLPPEVFHEYECLIGDEVHGWKADRLSKLAEKCIHAPYRFGVTGTLDGIPTHQMVVEGLFGPVLKVSNTKELIKRRILSPVSVHALHLKWPQPTAVAVSDMPYHEEIQTIVSSKPRNQLIVDLTKRLDGNNLVLFQLVEEHGNRLKEVFDHTQDVYYVHGKVEADQREEIRHIVETAQNAVILASYGTFSTGINIRRIHNIIFASPTKSRVRLLQSIGRGLRTAKDKSKVRIIDLIDDLRTPHHVNYAFRHWHERKKIYESEGFAYVERNIDLAAGNVSSPPAQVGER